MFSFLEYEFMQNALLSGILVSLLSPVLWAFLIVRRYTLISDTLAHTSLTWVIIGILSGISPFITTIVYSLFSWFVIEKLRLTKKLTWDMVLALILATNLSFVAIAMSLNSKIMLSISSYLFWSITLVSRLDLLILVISCFFITLVLFFIRKKLLWVTYDEMSALAAWVKVKQINLLLILSTALLIALFLPIVGILLLGSLVVLPIIASTQISKSFFSSIIIAQIISVFSITAGILSSYFLDISASWSTSLLLVWFFLIFFIFWKFIQKK